MKCKYRTASMLKKLEVLSKYCSNKTVLFSNIFQCVFAYENEYFTELVVISTFKKLFDPTQWLFPGDDNLIIKGNLVKRMNTFICKKSFSTQHLATTFLAKQKDDKYKVYGNRLFLSFAKKYNVDKLYATYLPQTLVRDCSHKTEFYVEISYSKISDDFFRELFETIASAEDCGDEKFAEMKKKYKAHLDNEIMKLNIKERSEKLVKERQVSGVEQKDRKAKKAQKFMIKSK